MHTAGVMAIRLFYDRGLMFFFRVLLQTTEQRDNLPSFALPICMGGSRILLMMMMMIQLLIVAVCDSK